MSTGQQDTADSSRADHVKTLWTYERLQQQRGGRTDFLNNTGTQNSNMPHVLASIDSTYFDYLILI